MNIIQSNEAKTIGIVTDMDGLKNVGDFEMRMLEDWFRQVKMVFGDGSDGCIRIQFKLSDDPKKPGYAIAASVDGNEPHIVVTGKYPTDGKPWE